MTAARTDRELYPSLPGDPRVLIHLHELNRGKGSAIRKAAEVASGDYVIMWTPTWSTRPTKYLRCSRRARWAGGGRLWDQDVRQSQCLLLRLRAGQQRGDDCKRAVQLLYQRPRDLLQADADRAVPQAGYPQTGFGMEAEVTGKLLRRGFRPYEVPISYQARSREAGKKLTWRDGAEALWILFRARFAPRPT